MIHAYIDGLMVREVASEASNPVVLYIHGLGESSLCFQNTMERLTHLPIRQIAPDLPGYGRSPWPETPLSLDDCADLLDRWLGSVTPGPVVLIGHSMGGVLGQIICEKYPRRVKGFINVEGNISIGDCAFSGQVVSNDGPDFATRGFEGIQQRVLKKGLESPALAGYFASMRFADPMQFRRNSYDLVEASKPETLGERMSALSIPVHYIAGRPGGATLRSIELLEQAGVPCSILSPSSHWPFIDQPLAFDACIESFLGQL